MIAIALAFFVGAFLYSSAGFGGASFYLAVLGLGPVKILVDYFFLLACGWMV